MSLSDVDALGKRAVRASPRTALRCDMDRVESCQSPSDNRRISSTCSNVCCVTTPWRRPSRCLETDLTCSIMKTLRLVSPPSGGATGTWVGNPRIVPVTGITTTNPLLLLFKASSETINTGRRPACSRPIVGFRSADQISPRAGSTTPLGLLLIELLLLFKSISEGYLPRRVLSLEVSPRNGIGPKGVTRGVKVRPELLAPEITNSLVDHRRNGSVRFGCQIA